MRFLCLKSTSSPSTPKTKKGMLTTLVSYLVQTYATNDVIAKLYAAFTRYTQPSDMSPMQYAKFLGTRSLGCGEVCNEHVMKWTFVESPHESVRHSMPLYWIRTQGQPCTTQLVMRHLCERCRREPTSIPRKGPTVVKIRTATMVREVIFQTQKISSRKKAVAKHLQLRRRQIVYSWFK